MSSTSRGSHTHEHERRAHRHGDRELVEAWGTTAMQISHSSAGYYFHLGLSWSEKRQRVAILLSLAESYTDGRLAESYTLLWRWFDLTCHLQILTLVLWRVAKNINPIFFVTIARCQRTLIPGASQSLEIHTDLDDSYVRAGCLWTDLCADICRERIEKQKAWHTEQAVSVRDVYYL